MKKIIVLVILLAGMVYVVNSDLTNVINGRSNAAQAAGAVPAGAPTISIYKGNTKLTTYIGNFVLSTFLVINSPSDMTVNFDRPTVQKDGSNFTATSSDFKASVVQVAKKGFRIGPVGTETSSSSFQVKKGANLYLLTWTINSYNMPLGSYKMALSGYTAGNSTTTIPMAQVWSGAVTLTDSKGRMLNGNDYKLESSNGTAWLSTTTAPQIAFRGGKVRMKLCGMYEGIYEIVRDRLVTTMKPMTGTPTCNDEQLKKFETQFLKDIYVGIPITFDGDKFTLSMRTRTINASHVFKKYVPPVVTAPRVYPCDFVGPLEPGATRDCPATIINPMTTVPPTILSLSANAVSRGSTITITGTNFATSNVILLDSLADSTTGYMPVAVVTAPAGVSSISFTVPSQSICPVNTLCPAITTLVNGLHSMRVRTPAGDSLNAFNILLQ